MPDERLEATESRPETPKEDLDRRILRSSGWVALSYGGRSLLSMLSLLVLARLLEPRAFGLVALASTFVIVLEYIQASGLGAALIYRRRDLEEAAAAGLVLSTCAGVVLWGAAFLAAPLLADAFHSPALTDIVRVMSLLLLIRGLGVGPGAILERELDFRSRAKGELSAGLIQVATSISLAFAGFGVWSLVAGQLASAAVQTASFWLLVPWRPSPRRASWRVLRELVSYGRFVTAGNLLSLLNRTIDNMAVGRLLGTSALGFYTISFRLADFPTGVIGYVVGRVMFPAYSTLQNDLAAFRRAYVQNLQRVALLGLPVSIALIVAAEPIVLALLGEQWRPVITPLRILGIYGITRNFASTCGAVFQASGRPYLVPLLAIPHAVVVIPALLLLVPRLGISGAAVSMVAAFSASGIPAIVTAMRLLKLRARDLARALAPAFLCSALLALALAVLLPAAEPLAAVPGLLLLLGVGFLVYVGATLAFARSTVTPMWVSVRGSRPQDTTA